MNKVEQLKELNQLKTDGVINQEEFNSMKEDIISGNIPSNEDGEENYDDGGSVSGESKEEREEWGKNFLNEMDNYMNDGKLEDVEYSDPSLETRNTDSTDDLITELTGRMAYDKRLERLLGRDLSI